MVRNSRRPGQRQARLSMLGSPLVANTAGETVALPPYAMPGEIKWWVEVLKWHARKTFYLALSKAKCNTYLV